MTTRKKGDKWLTYFDVEKLTTLSETAIRRLVATDKFPLPVTITGRKVFVKREVLAWMDQQENKRRSA